MEQTYRIKTLGLKEGFAHEQTVELLAKLLKRSREQVEPLGNPKGVVVKKGLDLPAAAKYKVALEDCGCLSQIEPELERPSLLAAHEQVPQVPQVRVAQHSVLQIETPEAGPALEVFFPLTRCCNCGEKHTLVGVETPVTAMQNGNPLLVAIALPYCPDCAPSAYKIQPGIGLKAVGTSAALAIYVMGFMIPAHERALLGPYTAAWLALGFGALAWAAYNLLNKGSGKQTSRFQPLAWKTLRYSASAIEAVGFSFSNQAYAKDFARVNKLEMKNGRII